MVYRMLPTLETIVGWSPRLSLLIAAICGNRFRIAIVVPTFDENLGLWIQLPDVGADKWPAVVPGAEQIDRLAKSVASQPYLRSLVPTLNDGVCPLGLPVLCQNREHARRHFLQRGINIRAYWERLPREVTEKISSRRDT